MEIILLDFESINRKLHYNLDSCIYAGLECWIFFFLTWFLVIKISI